MEWPSYLKYRSLNNMSDDELHYFIESLQLDWGGCKLLFITILGNQTLDITLYTEGSTRDIVRRNQRYREMNVTLLSQTAAGELINSFSGVTNVAHNDRASVCRKDHNTNEAANAFRTQVNGSCRKYAEERGHVIRSLTNEFTHEEDGRLRSTLKIVFCSKSPQRSGRLATVNKKLRELINTTRKAQRIARKS